MIKIDRNIATIMKGLSILFIALHNILHYNTLPFVKENESTFFMERPLAFYENLSSFSLSLPYDFLSFAGFYGVPVFVFLSGYGLVCKWEKGKNNPLRISVYIYDNFKKLFILLIPAYLVYILLITKDSFQWGDFFLQITFFNNVVNNWCQIIPGVYWYFGLTLQLYILYIFYYRIRTNNFILVTTFLSVCMLIAVNPQFWDVQKMLIYVRHNSIGWLYCFTLGIFWARKETTQNSNCFFKNTGLLSCFLLCLLLLSCFNYYTWIVSPLIAILLCVSVSLGISKWSVLRRGFIWMGKHSSSIFVVHPIVRPFALKIVDDGYPVYLCVVVYLLIVLLISPFYTKLFNTLLNYSKIKFSANTKS